MHQLGAVCEIRFRLDLGDQLVILRPVCQRVDERVADKLGRIGDFLGVSGFSGGGFGVVAFGGLRRRAGRGILRTSSAERNDHHSNKQQCKDLFHFLNLLFYFALRTARIKTPCTLPW